MPLKSLAAGFILFIYFDTFSSQLSLLDSEFRINGKRRLYKDIFPSSILILIFLKNQRSFRGKYFVVHTLPLTFQGSFKSQRKKSLDQVHSLRSWELSLMHLLRKCLIVKWKGRTGKLGNFVLLHVTSLLDLKYKTSATTNNYIWSTQLVASHHSVGYSGSLTIIFFCLVQTTGQCCLWIMLKQRTSAL